MVATLSFVAIVLAVVLLGYLLPIIIIAGSGRTSGMEKLAWILSVILISWFAWILYAVFAPLNHHS